MEYTYKVVREYPDGSRARKVSKLTLYKPTLVVGGLYVHLGKGYPGMQRIISIEEKKIEE